MVKKVNETEFKNEALTGLSVVDFSATWCGPCKMLAPVFDELSEEITGINFFNVDVDAENNLAAEYKIMSIPAVVLFKNGEKVKTIVGFQAKEVLEKEIKGLL